MLIASQGYSFAGLGASTLVQGKDFNCNASICFAIGTSNHELLKTLQRVLNQYEAFGVTAFSGGQLTVDGFIGAQTLSAARAATAMAGLTAPTTKEGLAAGAGTLVESLAAFLDRLGIPRPAGMAPAPTTVATTPTPAPTPTTVITPTAPVVTPTAPAPIKVTAAPVAPLVTAPAVPSATVPSAAASLAPVAQKAKIPTWVWITAGVAGVAVIGAVGYAVLREPSTAGFGDDRSDLPLRTYHLYWGPTGQRIATVRATHPNAAVRKAPRPYSKYKGEIYAEYAPGA